MLQLRVEAIKWELPDTATFFLREVSGRRISYRAGQFITLVFTHHEEEIRRSYSLSSSPDEGLLSITVKRIANGEISRFMLTKIKPGDTLNAVEPAGRFTLTDTEAPREILLFAAGSGIVPVYSQLKYALSRAGRSRLVLVYSNINANFILFRNELEALAIQHPEKFTIIHQLSSEANRLNNLVVEQLVRRHITDLPRAEFYTCGPFTYMRMIRLTLLYLGVEPNQIRKENFVLETVPVAATTVNYPPRNIRIHFNNEMHDLTVGENQSILQAALQNNIALPYSCRVGDCSTCAAKCTAGTIQMAKNDVLTDADLAAGWILTCTGHAVSDSVVIEFGV
ncbi:2Fe-2S iron-sulfur cluster binding domain-containing protein [Mucilaginibacter sp. BJC16-A38]|uniref:2Fe-2S iron-sulfur cluster-binding protein n=1 Tax=Mucilaginibacter phenanthrenivorans TaxID=1234842 RepID=UPI0021589916|nr:2Fe-2S iron-sulfur cluster-binding protein [Mucilaginibacter phenanthrenivorans]MCR8561631.1 2Fe-2S iron-sulfur cluster binding domain-containing protein [Mucilaginibacter phenanthrenivorans]